MTLRNAGLHTKLMLALALLVTLLAGGSAHFVIEHERDRRLAELDTRAARIADVFSRALVEPVRAGDRAAIEGQISARLPDSEVMEVRVTGVDPAAPLSIVAGGRGADPGHEVVQERPIRYTASPSAPPVTIGTVRVVLSRAVAERTIATARRVIMAITLGIVATVCAVMFFLLKRLVRRPIQRLEAMVDRIAGGDLDARCPVTSGDELGRLAARVNTMADRLRESTARLSESERRYRGIFENALEGVFQLDRSGGLREANPAMARLVGAATPADLTAGDGAPRARRLFTRAQTDTLFETLARQGEIASLELRFTRLDGSPIWVQLNGRGVSGPDGETWLEGLLTDITARKQAETALHRTQAELAHVTRVTTLGELAASIAHEINQPLAAIVADTNASLNWLARDPPDLDSVRETLAAVVKDGHRAAEVIQRIRELARKTDPRRTPVDVSDVVRDVIPLVRTELLTQGAAVRTELADEPLRVAGDRVQLQQVVLNLIMNGLEAMSAVDDRPRELLVRSCRDESGQVLVTVRDSGVGLDPRSIDRVFDAFFTTKTGGMGMGLSIARSIVEAHSGRLWATANADHGATFHVALRPLAGSDPTNVG
jgi:PAS domain S-box-containing protein